MESKTSKGKLYTVIGALLGLGMLLDWIPPFPIIWKMMGLFMILLLFCFCVACFIYGAGKDLPDLELFFLTFFLQICVLSSVMFSYAYDQSREHHMILFENKKNTQLIVVTTYKDYYVVAPYRKEKKERFLPWQKDYEYQLIPHYKLVKMNEEDKRIKEVETTLLSNKITQINYDKTEYEIRELPIGPLYIGEPDKGSK